MFYILSLAPTQFYRAAVTTDKQNNWGLSRTIDILVKFSSLSLVFHLAAPDRTVVGSRPMDEESTDWAAGVMERGVSWGEGGEREREREREKTKGDLNPTLHLSGWGKVRSLAKRDWWAPCLGQDPAGILWMQSYVLHRVFATREYTRLYDHTQGFDASRHRESEQ